MTEAVDISIFRECCEQMKTDELIFDKDIFHTRELMRGLSIGSPKIDAHCIANGIHSFRDLESHGIPVPNENITHEEISLIQGYLFDTLVSRLNGDSTFQSIGLSAYVHKGFEFKNDLLRLVCLSHVSLVAAVQTFTKERFAAATPLWVMDQGHENCAFYHDFDVEQLRRDLESFESSGVEKVLSWAKFELEFGEFLRGHCPIPQLVELPESSKDIGASKYIHYRDLPVTAPPPATQIPSHEEAKTIFTTMYNTISSLLNYPSSHTLLQLFETMFQWQKSHPDMIAFTRLFWFSRIIPNLEDQFARQQIEKMFTDEFASMKVPGKIFALDEAREYKSNAFAFTFHMIRAMVYPPCMIHGHFVKSGLRFWAVMERFTCNMEMACAKFATYVKTTSDSMNAVVQNPLQLWARRISLFFAICHLKYEIENDIANVSDYARIFLCMSSCYKTLLPVLESQRTIELVYKHLPPKRPGKKQLVRANDVSRDLAVKSAEELETELMWHFFEGAFQFMRFCAKTNPAKFNKGEFYNAQPTYVSRMKPFAEFYPPFMPQYQVFQILHDVSNVSADKIKAKITKAWGDAKGIVAKAVEARGEKTPFLTNVLKSIVMSSIALGKWKEGQMFSITFDVDAIPCFQIQA